MMITTTMGLLLLLLLLQCWVCLFGSCSRQSKMSPFFFYWYICFGSVFVYCFGSIVFLFYFVLLIICSFYYKFHEEWRLFSQQVPNPISIHQLTVNASRRKYIAVLTIVGSATHFNLLLHCSRNEHHHRTNTHNWWKSNNIRHETSRYLCTIQYLVTLAMMMIGSVLFSVFFLLRPSFSPTMLGLDLLIVVAQFESLHRLHQALSCVTEIGLGVDPAWQSHAIFGIRIRRRQ